MSKIEKIKCDNCEKELEEGEEYYNGSLIQSFEGCDLAKQVLNKGDYCKKCFKKIFLEEIREENYR